MEALNKTLLPTPLLPTLLPTLLLTLLPTLLLLTLLLPTLLLPTPTVKHRLEDSLRLVEMDDVVGEQQMGGSRQVDSRHVKPPSGCCIYCIIVASDSPIVNPIPAQSAKQGGRHDHRHGHPPCSNCLFRPLCWISPMLHQMQ